ncbi:MAG TPA: penicillin-binding protein activator [Edaphocola sp.]|nr:penicillin-binding protein activator [Edaphocola sp.]
MKNKGLIITVLAIALITLGWWFWKEKNQQNEDKQVVKIGVILPLTGEAAPYGTKLKDGIEFAFNLKNGKEQKFELIFEDSKGDDKLAISSYLKLKSETKFIIGPFNSSEVIALSQNINRDKNFLLLPTATSPQITGISKYIFRIISSDLFDSKVLSSYITTVDSLDKISIVYLNNEYGVGFANSFKNSLKENNITLVGEYALENNVKDFRSIVSRIRNTDNESVVIIGINEIGYFLKQAKEQGLKSRFYSTGMIENPEVLNIAGESANGVVYTYPSFDLNSTSKSTTDFVKSFENEKKTTPSILEALGFDAFNLLFEAINEVGNDVEKVRSYFLTKGTFECSTGQLSFDENGDVIKPIGIKTIKNKEFIWLNQQYIIKK